MDFLPYEILEKILSSPSLSLEDVSNFCHSCEYNRGLLTSNRLWKTKFLQRWPELHIIEPVENWYKEVEYVQSLITKIESILLQMPPKYCCYMDISEKEFEEWIELVNSSQNAYAYTVEILREIICKNSPIRSIEVVPLLMDGNNTLKYYALKALRFIRKHYLRKTWFEYGSSEYRTKIMEVGATIIAQWCQPHLVIDWERHIAHQLDQIAEDVAADLAKKYPKHPFFGKTEEELRKWRLENIEENQYDLKECRQMFDCLKNVLVNVKQFTGDLEGYYDFDNSFINKVLVRHKGLPILLSVVYEAVARRLGIKFEPVNAPRHFLLRYREGRGKSIGDLYFIDGFYNGNVLRPSEVNVEDNEPAATVEMVMERIVSNIENSTRRTSKNPFGLTHLSCMELSVTIKPRDMNSVVQLARQYMLYNMDTKHLEDFIKAHNDLHSEPVQRVLRMLRDYERTVKITNVAETAFFGQSETSVPPRTPDVKFAVGMVMKHLSFNYICVICDWHLRCLASCEWQQRMNVHRLKFKADQPFYSVIADDGSERYVAQENLEPSFANPQLLEIEDIGRHFSHYFVTHFVPNAEKQKNYEEDAAVRNFYYQKRVLENPEQYSHLN